MSLQISLSYSFAQIHTMLFSSWEVGWRGVGGAQWLHGGVNLLSLEAWSGICYYIDTISSYRVALDKLDRLLITKCWLGKKSVLVGRLGFVVIFQDEPKVPRSQCSFAAHVLLVKR